jgi:hypothetical protein
MSEGISCLFGGLVKLVRYLWETATCNTVESIILLTGKTSLVKQLQARDGSLVCDWEEHLRMQVSAEDAKRITDLESRGESASLILYPLAKKALTDLKKDFRFKRIILVSSDLNMMKYLGIKPTLILTPSSDFYSIIQSRIDDPQEKTVLDRLRTDILVASKNPIPFNNWEALTDIVCNSLKLVRKL